jgi:pyruvate, water dikinase
VTSSGSLVVSLASASDVASVGGKGAALGSLARIGIAVPPGFVVTSGGYLAFMDQLDRAGALRAEISALPAADLPAISQLAARVREAITGHPFMPEAGTAIGAAYQALGDDPVDVAVRSSATVEDSAEASFAGLQDTYLGVCGADSVLEHVRRCWASLYNDESVAYRRRLGMPEEGISMAVVVQRMVRPRAAGVMFTRSPVTGDRSVVAIEGSWGLGSALVSGDVTPDSFVVSKITGEITGRRISAKERLHSFIPNGRGVTVIDTPAARREAASLTDDEIKALADAGRRVEDHYGAAQDIEWAILDGDDSPAERIVLLQSRPETVWAARAAAPVAAPKPHPADHVLSHFGKQW